MAHDPSRSQLGQLLDERRRFETLLARLSTEFIHFSPSEVDNQIERALGAIVEFLQIERSSLGQFSEDGSELIVTHSYTVRGYPPFPRVNLAAIMPWYTRELRKGEVLRFRQLPEDFPPEAIQERQYFKNNPLPRSHLVIPLRVANRVLGGVGFGSFRREMDWPEELVQSLQLVGDIFANALVRKQAQLKESRLRDTITDAARVSLMGELAASITHEVNQPLCAIVSNAQTLQRLLARPEPDVTEIQEIAADLIHDGERASAIIARTREMFRHSKREVGLLALNDLVHEMETMTCNEMARRGVAVTHVLARDLPSIRGDRIQLQQVILNLLTNGADAMAGIPIDRRQLRIETTCDADQVVLSVADAGVGITQGDESRIFAAFFTTKAGGMGMGLAVCQSIIENHGGRIWVQANPGPGSTFRVALPRGDQP